MTSPGSRPRNAAERRKQAEEALRARQTAAPPRSPQDVQRLLHELEVHQIELEMQNEELLAALAELEASLARYTDLYDFAPIGYLTLTADGTIVEANLAAAGFLGIERGRLLGRRLGLFVSTEFRAALVAFLKETCANQARSEFEAAFAREGQEPRVGRLQGTAAQPGPGGEPRCRVVIDDITDRRHLEEQLRQSRKLEAIGQLAGGVAHGFNNLLTIINGYSEVILSRLPADDPHHCMLQEINKAGNRAATLTHQLLAFSRKQILQPVVLNLSTRLAELQKMLRPLITEDIDLVLELAPDLHAVKVDPGQLDLVVMNLVVNARDAMPGGGELTITTENIELVAAAAKRLELQPGSYVLLTVRDTGCGMDEATRGHIFEPYFTTRAVGQGTGLGLAMVFGIIKQSGGHIEVDSTVGRGTTFRVYLPAHREAAVQEPEQADTEHPRGTETVLLVEDEEGVRALVRLILTACGYTLLEAGDGEEALRLVEQHAEPIHLLVTDVVMPRLSGQHLADRLLLVHPRVKILYLSGYPADMIGQRGVPVMGTAFLQKPFDSIDLARKVREVLDR